MEPDDPPWAEQTGGTGRVALVRTICLKYTIYLNKLPARASAPIRAETLPLTAQAGTRSPTAASAPEPQPGRCLSP